MKNQHPSNSRVQKKKIFFKGPHLRICRGWTLKNRILCTTTFREASVIEPLPYFCFFSNPLTYNTHASKTTLMAHSHQKGQASRKSAFMYERSYPPLLRVRCDLFAAADAKDREKDDETRGYVVLCEKFEPFAVFHIFYLSYIYI